MPEIYQPVANMLILAIILLVVVALVDGFSK